MEIGIGFRALNKTLPCTNCQNFIRFEIPKQKKHILMVDVYLFSLIFLLKYFFPKNGKGSRQQT